MAEKKTTDGDTSEGYRVTDPKVIDDMVNERGMGMKSRAIDDSQISAKRDITNYFQGRYGRLDETCEDVYWTGNSYGCWLPGGGDIQQDAWLQIDLRSAQQVGGIVTQGRPKQYNQWVASFQISYGDTPENLQKIEQDGIPKVFAGNTDSHSKVITIFPVPILCRYIRFHPVTWVTGVALRMELLRGNCSPSIDHADGTKSVPVTESDDLDKMFLLSLLDEVKSLPPAKKLEFRIRVMTTISDLKYSGK